MRQWGRKLAAWSEHWRAGSWSDRLHLAAVIEAAAHGIAADAVAQARQEGASWADIGATMGISRQSAWERFGQ